MNWVFDLPPALVCVLVVAAFVTVALVGMLTTRVRMHRAVTHPHLHNDLVGFFLPALGVFYGLLLGLVAVAAWEQHAEAEAMVTREATTLAALYRDVSVYPEPDRSELEGLIGAYLHGVIDEEWPLQRRGITPTGGVARAENLERRLARFEPTGAGETVMHAEAMREFNLFYEARRQRLDAVDSSLPSTLVGDDHGRSDHHGHYVAVRLRAPEGAGAPDRGNGRHDRSVGLPVGGDGPALPRKIRHRAGAVRVGAKSAGRE